MAYSSTSDMLKEFSNEELARLSGDENGITINEVRITKARNDADAMIDSYISGRIVIDDESIAPLINKISVDLTVFNLFEFYHRQGSVPNTVVWRKINTMSLLKSLQSGAISLPGTSPGQNSPPRILTNKQTDSKIFNKSKLDEFYSGS